MRILLTSFISIFLFTTVACPIAMADATSSENGWKTINSFNPGTSATPKSIGTDDQGILYVTGTYWINSFPSAKHYWLTRKSTDQGQTWSTIDTFDAGADYWASASAFAADHRGNLFTAGHISNASDYKKSTWIVRKSGDNGKTWETVDTFISESHALAMTVDSNNNIYVAGYYVSSADPYELPQGIIRKSSDGGKSWVTIGQISSPDSPYLLRAMDVDRYGNIYVIHGASFAWSVLKSEPYREGLFWRQVDFYSGDDSHGYQVQPAALKIAPNGDVYVAGMIAKFNHPEIDPRWIVRKSSDEGKTWRVVDSFVSKPGSFNQATSIGVDDKTGNVYVTGFMRDNKSPTNTMGILRMSTDGGETWSIQDQVIDDSILWGFAKDKSANLFTIGTSNVKWITRKFFPNSHG